MCECEYRGRIEAFYDGELPAEADREVSGHLAECGACQRELDRLQKLSSALKTVRVEGAPQDVLRRAHQRVRAARNLPKLVLLRMARRASLVAAALLVACCLWLWRIQAPGGATAVVPGAWETVAVSSSVSVAKLNEPYREELMARWIVQDLNETREN